MVQDHTIKAIKCPLSLNTNMTQILLKNNVQNVKDHLNQETCKEKQAIDPQFIETTSTNVFPIKNITVDKCWWLQTCNGLNNFTTLKNTLYIKIERQRRNLKKRTNHWKNGQIKKLLIKDRAIQKKII